MTTYVLVLTWVLSTHTARTFVEFPTREACETARIEATIPDQTAECIKVRLPPDPMRALRERLKT